MTKKKKPQNYLTQFQILCKEHRKKNFLDEIDNQSSISTSIYIHHKEDKELSNLSLFRWLQNRSKKKRTNGLENLLPFRHLKEDKEDKEDK